MLSKISLVIIAEASASAVTSKSSSYANSLECHDCIRSGFIYNVPTNQETTVSGITYSQNLTGLIATSGSYGGECCTDMTDTSNCGTSIASSGTLASDWATVNPASVDMDLAVARCPTKYDLCGATKEITITDTSDSTQTVTMSGSWTADDTCTWLVKAECGAPAFTIGGDVVDSEVEVLAALVVEDAVQLHRVKHVLVYFGKLKWFWPGDEHRVGDGLVFDLCVAKQI